MHLQCFLPTLRECALFRKRVLLDHVLVEYGLGYSVVSRCGMSEEEAPASAYLRAVPKCVAGFVYTERGNVARNALWRGGHPIHLHYTSPRNCQLHAYKHS